MSRDQNPFPYLSHAYMATECERRYPGALARMVLVAIVLALVVFGMIATHL